MDVEGCRCLVIGGSRHLGRRLALSLSAAGAHVAVSSRSAEGALATCRALEAAGHSAAAVTGDVSTSADASRLVRAAAEALGGLDALVFAASGPFQPHPPQELSEQDWNASMDVLARGLLFVAQAARQQFLAKRQPEDTLDARDPAPKPAPPPDLGVIVALTDVAAVQPWAAFAAHCAAKAAELMLVRVLAKAWAAEGIRVCGVAPGPVDLPDDEHRAASVKAAEHLPAGRLVDPEDVAAAVLLCITSAALTGANLPVDGGALLR